MWYFWGIPSSPLRVLTQEGAAVVEVPMELELFLCALFHPKTGILLPVVFDCSVPSVGHFQVAGFLLSGIPP